MKQLPKLMAVMALGAAMVGCQSVGQNFSSEKVSQIKKGETTETELVQWFGPPENRSLNSEGDATLTWNYGESTVKGESFIPYAGVFMGGHRSKHKMLMVRMGSKEALI